MTLKYLQITCPDYRNDYICANLPSTLKKIKLIYEPCSPNDSDRYQNEINELKIPQNFKVTFLFIVRSCYNKIQRLYIFIHKTIKDHKFCYIVCNNL